MIFSKLHSFFFHEYTRFYININFIFTWLHNNLLQILSSILIFLIVKHSLSQSTSEIRCLFMIFCVPANICRDVDLLEAILYQITISEVTKQAGVYGTGQAGPSAISSAMYPEGQSQISPWLPQSVLQLPESLSFPGAPNFHSTYSDPLSLLHAPGNFLFFVCLFNYGTFQMYTKV